VLLEEFRIESANNNEIFLQINSEDFVKTMKSSQNASDVAFKLTKKDNLPILLFNITSQSRTGKRVVITQEVPVKVLSVAQAEELNEPMVPDPDVSLSID
jgi:HUS1 checkpoint protein